jgi:tyrosinase
VSKSPADGHHHPQTFKEAIHRGFPPDRLEAEAKAHRRRSTGAPEGLRADRDTTTVRRDQATLPPVLRTAFREAVQRLVNDGAYLPLVRHHMDMTHNMHGSMGYVGLLRFLAWHRRYLLAFERELQRVDRILRPGVTEPLGIPYWRWPDPFPSWLNRFLPQADPDTGQPPPPRKNAAPPRKPTAGDVRSILNDFGQALPGQQVNDYVRFTYVLEGWFRRPNGGYVAAHNHVHTWVGAIMDNISASPTDPIFWLHHAEVDRLWHIWQLSHPNMHPPLTGSDAVMDPWAESYAQLVDVQTLNYQFESVTP